MNRLNPKIVLLLGVLCASLSSILVRYSEAPSLITATYRLVWTVILLAPVVILKHRKELKQLNIKSIGACVLSGIFLAFHFAAFFESLKYTTITSCTALVSTEVIFTAIGFLLFLKGRIPKIGMISIAITFLGSVIIAMGDKGISNNAIYGDMLALGAAIFVAIYTLIGRVQRANISTSVYTFLVYLSASITLICLDVLTETSILGYGLKEILIGLGLGVFCTLLGHSIFSWSLKYISPSYVSASKLCEPVFATVMGMAIFGEMPKMVQILGAIIIIGGVYTYSKVERVTTQN